MSKVKLYPFNPLTTNVPHHIETSQLICNANQLTGFYMIWKLVVNGLNEYKFRHGFRDTVDPTCKCGLDTDTTLHFLLHCRLYSTSRTELLGDISTADSSLTNYPDEKLLNILLYGSEYFSVKTNQLILKSTIKFLQSSERFDDPLFL